MASISPITLIFNAVDQASPVLRNLVGQVQNQLGIVTSLSFAYNEVTQAIQTLSAQGQVAYQKLIGQNVELQGQLLSTQATLVATNKVLENGLEIKDPTKAIQSLTEPVREAVSQIRQGSLELVGVTSAQLIPLFQITAQSSAAIGANLNESADLTLSFAAALGTLQIPLEMARQELNSIYTAQITSDSQLAKSLNLNNQMVNQWKSQGVFVERITERLGAFRAGNALAAQTIDGVSSNIQELFDEIARVAGEPLLAPIVEQLTNIYNFLNTNRDVIQGIATSVVEFFLMIVGKLGEAIKTLQPVIETLAGAIFTQVTAEADALSKVIIILVDSFIQLVEVSTPLLQILANIVKVFADFSSTDIGGLIVQTTLLVAIIGKLAIAMASIVLIKIIPFLILLVPKFIAVAQAAKLFWLAVSGNAGALLALQALVPLLGQVTAAFIAAGGGVAGFVAAAKALLLVPAVLASVVVALTAVATAAALAWREQQRLADTTEALEVFRQTNEQILDQALKTAEGLKTLNQAEKDNGFLTKEQQKEREKLQKVAKNQVESLKSQLSALKELQPANEAQRNAQQAQIKVMENYIDLLNRQAGGVELQALDLRQLGNDFEQLSKNIENAQNKFNQPIDSETFKNAAKEIVDLTNSQVEAGQVSAQVAIARLEKVRNDTRVEVELRQQAQEAINKIRQSEVDESVQILQNQQNAIERLVAGEIISQVEGQKQITYNKILQLKEQLKAVRQSIKEETELRNQQIKEQIKGIDTQIAEAEKRRDEAEKQGDKQNTRLAKEDIARLNQQKEAAKQSLNIDSDRLAELKKQEDKFKTDLDKTVVQQRTEQRQQRLKDFDEQQAILEAQNARRLITQEAFNQQSLEIAQRKADEELRVLAEQEAKLRPGREGKDGREEIAAKRATIQKKLAEDLEKFEAEKSQIRLARLDAEQKITAAKLSQGQITEEQFYKESFENTKNRLQAELDEVDRQRSRLKPGDSRLAALDGQTADIRKKQLDNFAEFQQNQLKILETTQKRARDIVSQSEQDRLNEITRLEADKSITSAKANELRVNNSRKTVESELQLEKEKLAELEALPKFSDPVKETQRQEQIRASRLKTAQLTKSLIDNEVAQREAAFKVFEDLRNKEIQKIQNQATAETQLLDNQIKINEFASKNLGIQQQLLNIRKDLISSTASYLEGELNILSQISKSETKKKRLAESAAEVRLKAVREQAVFERKLLEIQIEQTQNALEQEKIQLRIEKLKARAATLTAQTEEEIVNKDLNANQNQRDAARLRTQAAILSEGLLANQESLLENKAVVNRREAEASRIKLRNSSQLSDDQARLALANARVNVGQGNREKTELDREIRNRRFTADDGSGGSLGINENTGRNVRFIRRETDFDKETFNRDGSRKDPGAIARNQQNIEETRRILSEALGLPFTPPINNQQPTDTRKQTDSRLVPQKAAKDIPQSNFTGGNISNAAVNKQNQVDSKMSNFTVNISNTFSPNDVESGKVAKNLSDQIRGELYNVFLMANRR